jgi:hypothetical protein
MNDAEVRRLRNGPLSDDDALVTLGLFGRGPDLGVMDVVRDEWALAQELNIPVNLHVGQGIFPGRPALKRLNDEGMLGPRVAIGHANLLTDEEMGMMRDTGTTVTTTPEIEAVMGHGWSPINRLLAAGVRPNIGIDTVLVIGGDMFTAMRSALVVARGLPNAERLKAGENPMALHLHPRDVLAFATIEGARALGKADVTGSITVGKKADIVTMTTDDISVFPVVDPVSAIVYGGSRRAVTNVFVDGRRRKADGALVGVDTAALHEAADRAARALIERSGTGPSPGGSESATQTSRARRRRPNHVNHDVDDDGRAEDPRRAHRAGRRAGADAQERAGRRVSLPDQGGVHQLARRAARLAHHRHADGLLLPHDRLLLQGPRRQAAAVRHRAQQPRQLRHRPGQAVRGLQPRGLRHRRRHPDALRRGRGRRRAARLGHGVDHRARAGNAGQHDGVDG